MTRTRIWIYLVVAVLALGVILPTITRVAS
jgi:hypothetical protein